MYKNGIEAAVREGERLERGVLGEGGVGEGGVGRGGLGRKQLERRRERALALLEGARSGAPLNPSDNRSLSPCSSSEPSDTLTLTLLTILTAHPAHNPNDSPCRQPFANPLPTLCTHPLRSPFALTPTRTICQPVAKSGEAQPETLWRKSMPVGRGWGMARTGAICSVGTRSATQSRRL